MEKQKEDIVNKPKIPKKKFAFFANHTTEYFHPIYEINKYLIDSIYQKCTWNKYKER